MLKEAKKKMFSIVAKLRSELYLNFDCNLFFDKYRFCTTQAHIFGLSNQILDKFELAQKQQKQGESDFKDSKSPPNFGLNENYVMAHHNHIIMKGRQTGGAETPKGPPKI